MTTLLVNLQSGGKSGAGWNNLKPSDTAPISLNEPDATATSWTVNYVVGATPAGESSTAGLWPLTGDAAFIESQDVATCGHYSGSDVDWVEMAISGPANTDFTVDAVSNVSFSGRSTDWQLNSGAVVVLVNDTASEVAALSGSTDANGDAVLRYKRTAGSGSAYATAFRIQTVEGPSVSLDNNPQLGAVLSGTGSNYAAQPTGPISITQGARSLPDMPITVSAWDAATGSFNWTTNAALPGFPANGADTTPFVLTGEDVTITLPDPGA